MPEKYKPSPEEIEKAENMAVEGEMTPKQEKMSEERKEDETLRQDGESLTGIDRELYEKMMNTFRMKNIKKGDKIDVNCKDSYTTSGYLIKITTQSFFLKIKTSPYGEDGYRIEEFKLVDLDGIHRIMEDGMLDLSRDRKSIFPDKTQF